MEFLIITGLSGAGKTRAADVLEDLDYYCVDNMPVALMPRFAELCLDTRGRYEKVALVTDTRDRDGFGELLSTIEELRKMAHPLAEAGMSMEDAVRKEEELLAPIKAAADHVVNSSGMTLGALQNRLFSLFAGEDRRRELAVTVMSFGFKHGIPLEADLVFDVRFLPNPYYVESLQPLSGLDRPVAEYVFQHTQTREFLEKLEDMIAFLLPYYKEEGKVALTVAIGCTGGRHRSVAIAAALHQHLVANGVNSVNVNRDIHK